MGYPQFDMKFSEREPPKLSKNAIDAMYMEELNNGRIYVGTMKGPIHISDWRDSLYKEHGINP